MSKAGCWTAESSVERIEELLLESISSEQQASRLCAVQWAIRLFPFAHLPSRYVCIMGAGDAKLEVREEALAGLKRGAAASGEPKQSNVQGKLSSD